MEIGGAQVDTFVKTVKDPLILAFLFVIVVLVVFCYMLLRSNLKKDKIYGEVFEKKDQLIFGMKDAINDGTNAIVRLTDAFNQLVRGVPRFTIDRLSPEDEREK